MTETNGPTGADDYYFFWGGRCSQWFKSKFVIDEIEYNCAEQYMMAQKALLFNDLKSYKAIINSDDPKTQKAIGRRVANFDEHIWDEHKYQIVLIANVAKFSQNEDLKKFLVSLNGKIIVEASPYDTIWGIGLGQDDPRRFDETKWRGLNLLGKVLMETRDNLS